MRKSEAQSVIDKYEANWDRGVWASLFYKSKETLNGFVKFIFSDGSSLKFIENRVFTGSVVESRDS